jgi:hypothetical protein
MEGRVFPLSLNSRVDATFDSRLQFTVNCRRRHQHSSESESNPIKIPIRRLARFVSYTNGQLIASWPAAQFSWVPRNPRGMDGLWIFSRT